MSEPLAERAETKQQQQKGPEAYLSGEERKQLQRMLGFPEDIPKKFWTALLDYVAVNGLEIPISQVRGYQQTTARSAKIGGATQSTSSASYVDLGTVGPELTGLGDGSYIFWYGCYLNIDADVQAAMSISVNGATADDADACRAGVDGIAGADQVRMSISIATSKTLSGGGNNTVRAKYRKIAGASDAVFGDRWIIALRVGN